VMSPCDSTSSASPTLYQRALADGILAAWLPLLCDLLLLLAKLLVAQKDCRSAGAGVLCAALRCAGQPRQQRRPTTSARGEQQPRRCVLRAQQPAPSLTAVLDTPETPRPGVRAGCGPLACTLGNSDLQTAGDLTPQGVWGGRQALMQLARECVVSVAALDGAVRAYAGCVV
jgi:hypothetical protein